MSDWLNAVREVLDRAVKPVCIFFRDDDAGWSNDKLYVLLDVFAQSGMPIDVAVIPETLDQDLADELLSRWQQGKHLIGLHQHGYSHTNHEPVGRQCEFGNSRTKNQQKKDIAKGQKHLRTLLGNALDPNFTPPWNRCTQATVECLEELDFRLLSQDVTAVGLESSMLQQVPVNLDWSRILKMSANPLLELGQAIAINLEKNDLTGIMLHHAAMDGENLKTLAELLAVFADHNNMQGLLLRDTLG
jgi:peptidoglycan/xylan/chitin deacetylase (PgdA/CDA1 family)